VWFSKQQLPLKQTKNNSGELPDKNRSEKQEYGEEEERGK